MMREALGMAEKVLPKMFCLLVKLELKKLLSRVEKKMQIRASHHRPHCHSMMNVEIVAVEVCFERECLKLHV
jgi:hypothetical protein